VTSPHISLYLPIPPFNLGTGRGSSVLEVTSPHISLYLPISPFNLGTGRGSSFLEVTPYLPISPHISLYLPISPYIPSVLEVTPLVGR
jgi:hypothetical protein